MIGDILIYLFGVLSFPAIVFLRARRSEEWDDSNLFNAYRAMLHFATRPSDFSKMIFPDGKRPFWYINKDEYSEIVKTKHED